MIIAIKDKDKVVIACSNPDSLDRLTDADYDDDMEYDFMDEDSFEDREDEGFTEEEEEM